jgi:hypothetical protein
MPEFTRVYDSMVDGVDDRDAEGENRRWLGLWVGPWSAA